MMKNFFLTWRVLKEIYIQRGREKRKNRHSRAEGRNCEKEWWKSKVLATVNQAQVKLCKETWKMRAKLKEMGMESGNYGNRNKNREIELVQVFENDEGYF